MFVYLVDWVWQSHKNRALIKTTNRIFLSHMSMELSLCRQRPQQQKNRFSAAGTDSSDSRHQKLCWNSKNGENWTEHSGLELSHRGQTSSSFWGSGSCVAPCCQKEERRCARPGELEGKIWLSAVVCGICHRLGERVALSLSLWQERRRWGWTDYTQFNSCVEGISLNKEIWLDGVRNRTFTCVCLWCVCLFQELFWSRTFWLWCLLAFLSSYWRHLWVSSPQWVDWEFGNCCPWWKVRCTDRA